MKSAIIILFFTAGFFITFAVFKKTEVSGQLLRNIARGAVDINSVRIYSLNDNPDCQELKVPCMHMNATDNLSILECVKTFTSFQLETMPDKCQYAVWEATKEMISSKWVEDNLLKKQCLNEKNILNSCINTVDIWSCIKDRALQIEDGNKCLSYIKRVHAVFFPDYENLGDFFKSCSMEIDRLQCGRLNIEHKPISQLETVECLQQTGENILGQACKASVKWIEWQEAKIKLFEICSEDLKRLCPQKISGRLGAFWCLVKNKNNPALTGRCSDQVSKTDNEIAKEYPISDGLAKACKADIMQHHCRPGVSKDKQMRLAHILLCLETVVENGTRIAQECRIELFNSNYVLISDYHLSPEIRSNCFDDIPHLCGIEIIHCLMEAKRLIDRRLTPQCERSVEKLIKVYDGGEDWRADPVLRRNCRLIVNAVCRDADGGLSRVMSCLMEQIGSHIMSSDCELSLMLIQYFVAREFKLDPQFYEHCHDDAIKYCHAKEQWDDVIDMQNNTEGGPLIPCLHRIAYSDDEHNSLRPACFKDIKRVMRQRAVSVDLIPEVEDACIEDLSYYCLKNIGRGAEMDCLKTNLEKLQTPCRDAVSRYTEEGAAHVELNPVVRS